MLLIISVITLIAARDIHFISRLEDKSSPLDQGCPGVRLD